MKLYNFSIYCVFLFLKIFALFNSKMKLFVNGRKAIFKYLEDQFQENTNTIWIHTASLGEFEQGLPVLEELQQQYPTYKFIITFFSPSGYEVKKNSNVADVITYLPLDTTKNAKRFLDIVQPSLAIFVKYEFWPNYLNQLRKRNIPTLLVSGIFREKQHFFKWYGGFMRDKLKAFDHFFLQDENSAKLLDSIGFKNHTVCGDTRFNRVLQILERDNSLDFIQEFKDNKTCVVIGSSWPEDEEIITPFINQSSEAIKYIFAPHKIEEAKIATLTKSIDKKVVRYSEKDSSNLTDASVLIVDTIGLLTKIYSYADIAYVGGGMGNTGLHNTLEPAVFGIPVIIGQHYQKFNEAKDLVAAGGVLSVSSEEELAEKLDTLLKNKDERNRIGAINDSFLKANANALSTINQYINKKYNL